MQDVLSTKEYKYLYNKTSSYLRSLLGKIQVTVPSLTLGHSLHPVCLCCRDSFTKGAQNLPTPICDSKHLPKGSFSLWGLVAVDPCMASSFHWHWVSASTLNLFPFPFFVCFHFRLSCLRNRSPDEGLRQIFIMEILLRETNWWGSKGGQ